MTDTGYSGTQLARKLGLRDGQAALMLAVPADLSEITAFSGFEIIDTSIGRIASRRYDYIHVFETDRTALKSRAEALAARLKADGMLWVSWPKRASGVATTLTENALREIFLPVDLVDVKVCAIDPVWSGLKFMFRKEARASLRTG